MHEFTELTNPARRNILAAAGLLAVGITVKNTAASPHVTSNIIRVGPDDSTLLHSILSTINADTTVIFEAGIYDLSSWGNRVDFTHSIHFIAPNGKAVLMGDPAVDFVGLSLTQPTDCFLMHGIQLNLWKYGLFITSALTHADSITIDNCQFVDVERGINGHMSNPNITNSQICSLKITHCVFRSTNSTSPAMAYGIKINQTYAEASIANCSFRNLSSIAIVLSDTLGTSGAPDKEVSLLRLNTLIASNHISNINSHLPECHAILVAGDRSVISSNTIDTLITNSPSSTGCEGIYIKCRNSVIIGNNIKNAGTNEAAIIIKGAGWDDGSTSIGGYGCLISNNIIIFEEPFLAPDNKTAGISLHSDHVSVVNNYIEGASQGVKSGANDIANIHISGNRIVNFYSAGISLDIKRENYSICNNNIQSYVENTSQIVYGIIFKLGNSTTSTKNIIVDNNLVSHEAAASANKHGISIYRPPSSTVVILGATIIGNKVEGFDYGIFFNIKSPSDGNYTATHAFMKDNLIFNCNLAVSGLSHSQYMDSGNL